MTGYNLATLTCDGCGEIFDDGQSLRISEARKRARAYAWGQKERGTDYCAVCLGTHRRISGGHLIRIEGTRP